jgi:hypothetical protein
MRLTHFVVGAALLAATPAWSAEADLAAGASGPAARARVDLRAGLGVRDDVLTAGSERVSAKGGTVSELTLSGAWFPALGHWGLAGRLELERFGLRRSDSSESTPVTGLELGLAGAGRLARGPWSLEGQLGWAFVQVPLVGSDPSGTMPLRSTPVTAHGPLLAALVAYRAAHWLSVEATGQAIPVTFGGDRSGRSVPLHRLSGGLAAVVGALDRAGVRFAGMVSYDLGSTGAAATGLDLSQVRHQVGLGVRATMLGPVAAPVVTAPPPASAPAVAKGWVVGTVHTAPFDAGEPLGPALSGVTISVAGHQPVHTDARGEFRVDGLVAGLVRMHVEKAGHVASEEVVSVPPDGEARVALTMRPTVAPALAALIAFVRDDNGVPVSAHVKILERSLAADADDRGQVRFDVPPGRYTVVIEAPGFLTQRKAVRTVPGEQSIYDIDLQREH